MKMNQKLNLSYDQQHRLSGILEFMVRGKPIQIKSVNEGQTAFSVPFHYDGDTGTITRGINNLSTRWVYIDNAMLLFYTMPEFFKLGKLHIDLEDIDSLIEIYNSECTDRMSTEETTEKAATGDYKTYDDYDDLAKFGI